MFTEVYTPIINGVVASIDGLRAALRAAGIPVTLVAPRFPAAYGDENDVLRLPSLRLPTATGYRLCIPYLRAHQRAQLAGATIVHAHSPFVSGWLAANIARRRGIPLVFTYHTRIDAYTHYLPFDARITRAAMIALTRAFANRCNTVIAPTYAMRERLQTLGVRVPIAVVPSAIDGVAFSRGVRTAALRARLGARDDETVLVLAVSRIAKEKQLELAIDALVHVERFHLAIVGDGSHRIALEARARAAGVRDRVTFTGAVPRAALPDIYAAADAFVFPSETETQGLVLAEALAATLPIVAVASAVNREVLAGAGQLVAPDAAALGAALRIAAAAPRDRAAALAAVERFAPERQRAAMLKVYESLSVCRTFGTPAGHHTPEDDEGRR